MTLFALGLALFAFSCKPSEEMTQKVTAAERQLDQCQQEADRYQARLNELQAEKADYQAEMQQMERENREVSSKLAQTQAALESVTRELQATSDDYGTWFRVQIGAYQDPKINPDLQTTEDGLGVENANDLQKIVLGRFRDYEKAKQLQNQMKTLGIEDAWIASYQDGQRVPIEQAIGN